MHEILRHFDRLVGLDKLDTPIGVNQDPGCQTEYLHERKTSALMKQLAIRCYNLDPKSNTIRYGSHSIRIGACVALHAAGVREPQLKFLLRWKSDSFMKYLRKIARLSQVQNAALALAASQPR